MVSAALKSPPLKDRVMEILSHVPDPEIPCVSVVDLGIVRDVTDAAVVITPTYTGCPATLTIEADIRVALNKAGLSSLKIETVLTPPWSTDWISAEGRAKLHTYGIAPPAKTAPQCPCCGSAHTEELSRFGSTPCKSLHRCLDCREPFDRFKCH